MRNMFNRAVDWDFIEENPINKVKIKNVLNCGQMGENVIEWWR